MLLLVTALVFATGAQAPAAKSARGVNDDEDDPDSWAMVVQVETPQAKAKPAPAPKASGFVANRFKKVDLKCPWCKASSKDGTVKSSKGVEG